MLIEVKISCTWNMTKLKKEASLQGLGITLKGFETTTPKEFGPLTSQKLELMSLCAFPPSSLLTSPHYLFFLFPLDLSLPMSLLISYMEEGIIL